MSKTPSLTVHKNKLAKKHRKAIQEDMVAAARRAGTQDVRAYALVTIRADGSAQCWWDTGSIMPMWGFASTIGAALNRDISESGVDETWRPELSERERPDQ